MFCAADNFFVKYLNILLAIVRPSIGDFGFLPILQYSRGRLSRSHPLKLGAVVPVPMAARMVAATFPRIRNVGRFIWLVEVVNHHISSLCRPARLVPVRLGYSTSRSFRSFFQQALAVFLTSRQPISHAPAFVTCPKMFPTGSIFCHATKHRIFAGGKSFSGSATTTPAATGVWGWTRPSRYPDHVRHIRLKSSPSNWPPATGTSPRRFPRAVSENFSSRFLARAGEMSASVILSCRHKVLTRRFQRQNFFPPAILAAIPSTPPTGIRPAVAHQSIRDDHHPLHPSPVIPPVAPRKPSRNGTFKPGNFFCTPCKSFGR